MEDEYLTTDEVARLLSIKSQTLRKWRMTDQGPPYIKIKGDLVRYSRNALVDYIHNKE